MNLISQNLDVANALVEQKIMLRNSMSSSSVMMFDAGRLEMTDLGFKIDGLYVKKGAEAKILEALQIRPGFAKKMGKKLPDWENVRTAMIQTFGGKLACVVSDNKIIDVLHLGKDKEIDVLSFEEQFDVLINAVASCEKPLIFSRASHDNTGLLTVQLGFDGESGMTNISTDAWRAGTSFSFGWLGANVDEYLERLVCSNGMVQRTSTRYDAYNIRADLTLLSKMIDRRLNSGPGPDRKLMEAITAAKNCNISAREFYVIKNITDGLDGKLNLWKGIPTGGAMSGFDDEFIKKSYGDNILNNTQRWLSTADTGINAYDFINSVTWVASHQDEYPMDHSAALKLQMQAANLLFGNLDMADMAPKLNFN